MIITMHRLYARRHVDVHSYLATNIVATIALYFSYYYLYCYQNHYYHFYYLFLVLGMSALCSDIFVYAQRSKPKMIFSLSSSLFVLISRIHL